jgi:hypothetical protein
MHGGSARSLDVIAGAIDDQLVDIDGRRHRSAAQRFPRQLPLLAIRRGLVVRRLRPEAFLQKRVRQGKHNAPAQKTKIRRTGI